MFTASFLAMKKVLPNRRQVAQDLSKVFEINEKVLRGILHHHQGVFHLATDCWTDRGGNAFMGVTAHWTEVEGAGDVRPQSILLDFIA